MILRTSTALLFLFAALSASPAVAPAQPTPVPDIKGDMASMAFFNGTWTCKTVKNAGGRGTGRVETDVVSMSMDGHYQEQKGSSKPFDAARTRTVVTDSWLGWDSARKQWYTFGISNFGGFTVSTSPGWVGDKLVLTDTYATDGVPLGVTTMTKKGASAYTLVNVTKTPKGSETTEADCTKK